MPALVPLKKKNCWRRLQQVMLDDCKGARVKQVLTV